MRLATWNVNSLKVRLPQVLDWLRDNQPDALCLQETKLEDVNFPLSEIREAGYDVVFSGQRAYNGVAILSQHPLEDVSVGLPGFHEQKRVIAATIAGVRVICVYVPNGQSVGSEKYLYKLSWFEALAAWLGDELKRYPKLAILGEYNVAPEDCDIHDPAVWQDQVLASVAERDALKALMDLGLKDSFRLFEQAEKSFSWWDYRMNAFRRNMGLRIDHILLSSALAVHCTACVIDKLPRKHERPSDHAPVMVTV